VLHSEKFQTDKLAPSYKCTDLEGKTDAYLVKGGKLYLINKQVGQRTVKLKRFNLLISPENGSDGGQSTFTINSYGASQRLG
jgi:hypothetical protein